MGGWGGQRVWAGQGEVDYRQTVLERTGLGNIGRILTPIHNQISLTQAAWSSPIGTAVARHGVRGVNSSLTPRCVACSPNSAQDAGQARWPPCSRLGSSCYLGCRASGNSCMHLKLLAVSTKGSVTHIVYAVPMPFIPVDQYICCCKLPIVYDTIINTR